MRGPQEQGESARLEVALSQRRKALRAVKQAIVRLVASPPLAPHTLEEIAGALSSTGSIFASGNDPDVNASAVSVEVDDTRLEAAFECIASCVSKSLSAGRAFRIDLMTDEPQSIADERVRSFAVGLHGAFSAPVFIARRETPAAAWAFGRPMPWGRKGLAVGQAAPVLPFGGSECLGVAIEVGTPTVVVKARLDDVPEHGLVAACAAVGGGDSGFAQVGAYPSVSPADGASVVVLEFGDLTRSPIHRTLAVLDIEARRFGGRLGQTALLSHIPLDALISVLRAETGLLATSAQVLETHLPRERAR